MPSTVTVFTCILFGILPVKAQTFDHSLFDQILKKHVDNNGRVNYAVLAKDRVAFDRYLKSLETASPLEMSLPEQLAFWINAYNAAAIEGVLNRYPTQSITNGSDKSFFQERTHRVAGQAYSLDMIEKQILLPKFGDARLHFVLVCSAIGCPNLLNAAYGGSQVQAQMEQQTRRFVNNPKKVSVSSGRVQISRIFEWYESDFIRNYGSVGKFLAKYLDDRNAAAAVADDKLAVEYLDYDWTLNDVKF
jgi:hypothetical protein